MHLMHKLYIHFDYCLKFPVKYWLCNVLIFFYRKLLAAAEPHGQVFTVADIVGNVQANSYTLPRNSNRISSSEPTRDFNNSAISMECNKKHLSWASVDIGETM